MLSYQEWVDTLPTQHDDQYWHNIIVYAKDISEDFKDLKQHRLAKKLVLSPTTLSIIKPLILALVELRKAQ